MAFNKVAEKTAQIMTVDPVRSKKDCINIRDWFYSKDWEKYAIIWWFGIHSGLRISDILGLKVADVFGREYIQIREQKTGKIKQFPLSPKMQQLLWDYCRGRDPEEWVFEGRGHRRLDRAQVYRRLNEAKDALKIDCHMGTHTMRKTFGYHSYRQYHDITLLQTIYNHTAPDVTKRYIGITQDEIDEYYRNFDLEDETSEFAKLMKKSDSRKRSTRALSICTNYMKNCGPSGRYYPFAVIIKEAILNDPVEAIVKF